MNGHITNTYFRQVVTAQFASRRCFASSSAARADSRETVGNPLQEIFERLSAFQVVEKSLDGPSRSS
jgi:hypothetical protein